MKEKRKGRQEPTVWITLPYENTDGTEAAELYNQTGRTAQEWQCNLLNNLLARDEEGLWTHSKFGYSVPRRNGKSEILLMRELYGLIHGEKILHTAHKVTTSSDAARKLAELLKASGWQEVERTKKGETYDKHFIYHKQAGAESIALFGDGGGICSFKTRTNTNALGLGVDLLIIDEAQEYTSDMETALKYVVTDSQNPQTIMCGTPPTAVSKGDVFKQYREACIKGISRNSGWAEWSVSERTDWNNIDAWYETNPSLGTTLTERAVSDEVGRDETDFNIQRLGLWILYNQASAITEKDWKRTELQKRPKLSGKIYVGIKYGTNGINTAMSVACKMSDGNVFISVIDCRGRIEGDDWIIQFIQNTPSVDKVMIDGKAGQQHLANQMKDLKMKKPVFPSGGDFIMACASFEQAALSGTLRHMIQPSLDEIVTNSEKKPYGNGGFTFKSLIDGQDTCMMDSVILAYWQCAEAKEPKKQKISY